MITDLIGQLSSRAQRSLMVGQVTFWVTASVFLVLDLVASRCSNTSPAANRFKLFKLQPNKALLISNREYTEIALVAVFNLFVSTPVVVWIFQVLYYQRASDEGYLLEEMDPWTPLRELGCFVGMFVVLDIWFFWTHALLHWSPWLYTNIHKIHHKWSAPCAMSAVYAHPLEHMFCNVGAIEVGVMMMNPHPYTVYGWYALNLFSTCCGHSGYKFPLGFENLHETHHESFRYNYGGPGLMDYLCGTKQKRQHPEVA